MPRVFLETKLAKGQAVRRSGRNVLAVKWKDRKDVHMLSTKHEGIEMGPVPGKRPRRGEQETIKPKTVRDYNNGMLGVDRQDQVLSSFPIMRRSVKAYKKIFFYLMDMAIFNSFCIFKKIKAIPKRYRFTDFRLNLVEQILLNIELPVRTTPGRPSTTDTPLRLQAKQWAHFPMQIPPTPCKQFPTKPCKVCRAHNRRSETRWLCKKCNVALHMENCFEAYHTKVDY